MDRFLLYLVSLFILLISACSGPDGTLSVEKAEPLMESLRKNYAPDSRTDRVSLYWRDGELFGYTTSEAAMEEIRSRAATDDFRQNVRLLPDTALAGLTVGLINVSVANLRSKPGHSQELATQALLGTPVQLLDFVDGWYLVRTPDRYIAWLEPGALVPMTPEEAAPWLGPERRLYLYVRPGVLRQQADDSSPIITDLVAGNILLATGRTADRHRELTLPDGSTGWAESSKVGWPAGFGTENDLQPAGLLNLAPVFRGLPYLWGGTSPKGMDCSGFTKTLYYMNGLVIPRDASQQVHAGEEVELTGDFANLQPGDLLFFGRYRDDGSEKITYVGLYLGNGRFLHAGADNGRIMENSLIEGEAGFAEHRLKSLLRARRLRTRTPGVVPISEAFSRVITGR